MGYVLAKGEDGIVNVDKLPNDIKVGDTVSQITEDEIVIHTDRGLWVAKNLTPDILDAEEIG